MNQRGCTRKKEERERERRENSGVRCQRRAGAPVTPEMAARSPAMMSSIVRTPSPAHRGGYSERRLPARICPRSQRRVPRPPTAPHTHRHNTRQAFKQRNGAIRARAPSPVAVPLTPDQSDSCASASRQRRSHSWRYASKATREWHFPWPSLGNVRMRTMAASIASAAGATAERPSCQSAQMLWSPRRSVAASNHPTAQSCCAAVQKPGTSSGLGAAWSCGTRRSSTGAMVSGPAQRAGGEVPVGGLRGGGAGYGDGGAGREWAPGPARAVGERGGVAVEPGDEVLDHGAEGAALLDEHRLEELPTAGTRVKPR